jgi:hypothetical protein
MLLDTWLDFAHERIVQSAGMPISSGDGAALGAPAVVLCLGFQVLRPVLLVSGADEYPTG